MQDRIPQYANRFKLNPVDGMESVFDIERMDGATQNGTPLNKKTLLSDETAEILGLEKNSPNVTPDSAFRALHDKFVWKKVVDFQVPTETKTLSVSLPDGIEKYSEIIIAIYVAGLSPSGIKANVLIETNKSNQIDIEDNAELSGVSNGYNKIGVLNFIDTGDGIWITTSNDTYSPNVIDYDEKIDYLVLECTSSYKFPENSRVLIFAR